MKALLFSVKIVTIVSLLMVCEARLSSGVVPAGADAEIGGALSVGITGVASYYSYECAGLQMSNGKYFDPGARTCASWYYKFGTVLEVTSLDTGRVTKVVVTDRGPNKRLVRQGRLIDLSKRAFEDICPLEKGLTRVRISIKPAA